MRRSIFDAIRGECWTGVRSAASFEERLRGMQMKRLLGGLVLFGAMVVAPLAAQPFGGWLVNDSGNAKVELGVSPDFDFGTAMTFEAWVYVSSVSQNCPSLAGNDYQHSVWVGVCGSTLRSYMRGAGTSYDAGTIPTNRWTHVAVTYDGVKHKHYVDGELAGSRDETGVIPSPTSPLRIIDDVSWAGHSLIGGIDEVRFWNVARTQAEIRSTILNTINAPTAGLIAVYHFDNNSNDAVGTHHGTRAGSATYLNPSPLGACTSTSTRLCLDSGRFEVTTRWIAFDGSSGVGTVVPGGSANSGLFWFFSPDNWEVLVKELNGCGVNNRRWVFAAATTNVHYDLMVVDHNSGETKRYLNYLGVSAPAVTDSGAFATCP